MLNKAENYAKIAALTEGKVQDCTKLEISNIVFPKWSDLGLVGAIYRQCVVTKEQPTGHIYEEAEFRTVLRILGGKVLINNMPDVYCWKFEKLQKAKSVRPIGCNCVEGIMAMTEVLNTIPSDYEKRQFAGMFTTLKEDFLLVTLPAEERKCVKITRELYDAGLCQVVDEWMEPDENGCAKATELKVGDYLIVSNDGYYCIRGEEFEETHEIH